MLHYHLMRWPAVFTAVLALWLSSCAHLRQAPEAGLGKALDWSQLPGWQQDQHAQAWPALINNCQRMAQQAAWQPICQQATGLTAPTDIAARQFFETHFTAHALHGENGKETGLITGYYEPLLQGSYQADARYRYPLYRVPDDLLTIDLGEIYPALAKKRVRGRLIGNKVVPYFPRSDIENGAALKGNELLWVDSLEDAFFLQIQGSGRVQLPDGRIIGAGYANQNGHAYVSIGKKLIERGEIRREDVTLFSIRDWLRQHPDQAIGLMHENPSFVFFELREDVESGPRGSLNVPLTAERSLAIDPSVVGLGHPVWLMTTHPTHSSPLNQLVFAQDTGGAIKGALRADLFWGTGTAAEQAAGLMKHPGQMFVLKPKP